MDVIVAGVSKRGVDGGEWEGAAVLREVAVVLVCCGVLAYHNAMVGRWLVRLLDVRIERHLSSAV